MSVEDAKEWLTRLAGNERADERWPRYRTGRREPIPWQVRVAIYERDGRRCLACGISLDYKEIRLDHIQPWSAFGHDWSDNLRVLCDPCNRERSNFRGSLDVWGARRPPVTFLCVNCTAYCGDDCCEFCADPDRDSDEPHPTIPGMVLAYCARCGIVSPAWEPY